MPGEMQAADIQQKLEKSILMRNNRPYLFLQYGGARVRVYDLLDQKEQVIEYSEDDWKAPVPRLGMVNINGSVVIAKRIPIRRYKLGLSVENLDVQTIPGIHYPDRGGDRSVREVVGLKSKALAQTIMGQFPSLTQALQKVSQFEGAVAFDRQFCVDSEAYLYYKETRVGKHDGNSIFFNEGYQHLSVLVNV